MQISVFSHFIIVSKSNSERQKRITKSEWKWKLEFQMGDEKLYILQL